MGQAGARLAAAAVTVLITGAYWSPTIVAVARRHPRLGLVILYNFLGVLAAPWFLAWAAVLAEPSRRPRKPAPVAPDDPAVVPFLRRPNGGAA